MTSVAPQTFLCRLFGHSPHCRKCREKQRGTEQQPLLEKSAASDRMIEDQGVQLADSLVLQYADDLLVTATDYDTCQAATLALLKHLAAEGFKVSTEQLTIRPSSSHDTVAHALQRLLNARDD
ncbi:hypothetical protein HF521_021947 [Silurus meridionalis]|uniref:Reverse transcriptase domain-containing protein n=1 Tax=Silurus meridionalis TaxID=175797 RepID=A0A8T0BCZ1_SILME|nr:hypothetical protein HF521_021947 [Silurus meridionalis]